MEDVSYTVGSGPPSTKCKYIPMFLELEAIELNPMSGAVNKAMLIINSYGRDVLSGLAAGSSSVCGGQ